MQTELKTILAIETSTSACSAALLVGGKITSRCEIGSNIHSKVLLSMVQELLDEAGCNVQQLDAVAVGQGPGSFTGLRIGVGVGQGIAYGAGCPMIGIPSLQVLAQAATKSKEAEVSEGDQVVAAIDARMGEVYWAVFEVEAGEAIMQGVMQVSQPENVVVPDKAFLLGNAWDEYRQKFLPDVFTHGEQLEVLQLPMADNMLTLAVSSLLSGDYVSAAEFAPIYVRDDVAKKSTKPLPGKRV